MPLNNVQSVFAADPSELLNFIEKSSVGRASPNARITVGAQQIAAAQSQDSLLALRQSDYNKVGVALQGLQSSAQSLSSMHSLLPPMASTSAPTILTAAAGLDAAQGSYSIVVNNIAQAQSNYSEAFSSATQAGLLTPGALSIAVGGNNPISFNIDNTTTLYSLADSLNSSGLGVAATVITDANGYRLSVGARMTGANNTLTFTDAGTGLNLEDHQEQSAQNASLQIDNSLNISSPTNTIVGAINGVTLQAVAQNTTAAIINVQANSQSLAADVQNLVSNYNNVITSINSVSTFNGTYDPTSLIGDPTLTNLRGELQAAVSATPPTAQGSFVALSQLGVSTQQDGTLGIDASQLQSAINLDPQSVAAMLSNSADGTQLGSAGQIAAVARDYGAPATGVLAQLSQGLAEQINQSTEQMADMQNAMATYQKTLRQKFIGLNDTISQLQLQAQLVATLSKKDADPHSEQDASALVAPSPPLATPVASKAQRRANDPLAPSSPTERNVS